MKDSTHKEFIAKRIQEMAAFRQALTHESDRGCALFAASYLDKVLSDLFYVSLVENRKIEEDLFEGTSGALHTFSAKIKLAYYLGKISAATRRDLDNIRKIRNKFAHHPEVMSFDDQSTSDICKNLGFSYHERSHRARGHFTAAVFGILAQLHQVILTSVAPTEKPDDRPTEEQKAAHRKQLEELSRKLNKSENQDDNSKT